LDFSSLIRTFVLVKEKWIILIVGLLLLTGCRQKEQHTFTDELLLPMTPVKDQGKSQLCWAYAMLATIETEHLLRGDSVNLSAVYI
jgi:bleomycin hydrolase